MTESEIYTALFESTSQLDSVFEFWISSSFAVLLAFFFAGGRITGFLKKVILLLYALTTLYAIFRIIVGGFRILALTEALESMESSFLGYSNVFGNFSAVTLITILIIGSISTIYFGINSRKLIGRARDDHT